MSQATTGQKFDAIDAAPVRLDTGRATQATALCETAALFAHRGWMLGGGGAISIALRRDPLRLLVTPDRGDKAALDPADCATLDEDQLESSWPEAKLHELLMRHAQAGAVIHTQSPATLALSDACAAQGGLMIDGYDLLRQFGDGRQPIDRLWTPVIDHAPNSPAPGRQLIAQLTDARQPARFGVLVRRNGLLAWGNDLDQARRHAELFETLFATIVNRCVLSHGRH